MGYRCTVHGDQPYLGHKALLSSAGQGRSWAFFSLNPPPLCSADIQLPTIGVAQLFSAQSSELEVPASILGDSNVCFDFLLIRAALALNTRKTEHCQTKGGKVGTEGHKFVS